MFWVLWDIVLPLIATFLLGLLIGWLLWRWRRRRVDADDLSKLRRDSARNKADVERLQQSNIELSDRLQAANGAGGGELASAKKRIDMLSEELKSSRSEVASLMIATLNTSLNQFGESGDTTSLMADVALRDRKIEELEALIATLKHS